MISLKGRTAMLSAGLLFALAGLARADVPAAMDRVPANAGMVIAVKNMEQTKDRMESFGKRLNAPVDEGGDENPLNLARKLLGTAGLNKTGSMAVALMPDEKGQLDLEGEEGKERAVMIVPVSDYAAFAKGLGAAETTGVASVTVEEKPVFVKDIGGGFAAMGASKERVEGFEGKGGNAAAHNKNLGRAGQQIADKSDVIFVISVPALKDKIDEAVTSMKEEAKDMADMPGPQGAQVQAVMGMAQGVMEAFARDGQVGIMGLGLGEAGVSLDFGAQFKEGSSTAKALATPGNAGAYLARVPAKPFLAAFAMDLTNPTIKGFMKDMQKLSENNPMGMGFGDIKNLDSTNGMAMLMGASKGGVGGGLFANTVTYVSTKDAPGYVKSVADTMKGLNGKTVEGIKFTGEYKAGEAEVSGVKVDSWSMTMEAGDDNPEMAGMLPMMQQMMFGPEGPGGMLAPVENGVVMTMSKNTPLMTDAIATAKSGQGLSNDEQIKAVQEHLPSGRMFELYLGTKPIMDAVNGFMGMFGGGVQLKVPDKVSPVGIAAGVEGGGVDVRIFVPTDVIDTIAAAVKEAQQMEEGEGMDEDAPANGEKPGKAPRF